MTLGGLASKKGGWVGDVRSRIMCDPSYLSEKLLSQDNPSFRCAVSIIHTISSLATELSELFESLGCAAAAKHLAADLGGVQCLAAAGANATSADVCPISRLLVLVMLFHTQSFAVNYRCNSNVSVIV